MTGTLFGQIKELLSLIPVSCADGPRIAGLHVTGLRPVVPEYEFSSLYPPNMTKATVKFFFHARR